MKKYIVMFIFVLLVSFGFINQKVLAQKKNTALNYGQVILAQKGTVTSGNTSSGTVTSGTLNQGTVTSGNTSSGTVTSGNVTQGTVTPIDKLEDPLGEGVSIEGLLLKLFDIILFVGVPIVAFFLIWSGFMFVTAQGKPEQIETAKSRLLYTLVGAALLLGAWTISQAISGTLKDIKNGAATTTTK